jgi:hypothetical protein
LEKLSKRDNFEVNPRLTLIVAVCEAHTKKFDVKTKGVLNVGRIETRGIPDFHVPAEKMVSNFTWKYILVSIAIYWVTSISETHADCIFHIFIITLTF